MQGEAAILSLEAAEPRPGPAYIRFYYRVLLRQKTPSCNRMSQDTFLPAGPGGTADAEN